MLEIIVPATEQWDEVNEVFINTKETKLTLEHSLVSLSKWESKWCKPFLSKEGKTDEETLDYIKCMTITQNVSDDVYRCLSVDNINAIDNYIRAPMTATWFSEESNKSSNSEQITSELIYYWMVAFNIPSKYEKWHLNRLLTLIRVCNVKNQPEKKKTTSEVIARNRALNEARRKKLKSKG